MTRITGPSSAIYTLPDPATTPAQPAAATPNTHRRRPRQLHEREIEHEHEQEHELQYQEQLTGRRKQLAKLAKRIRRPGLKRRNAANAADEPTTDSDFEELLMIMEEHARLSKPLLVGPSKQGNPHDGQQGRRGNNPQSDLAGRHAMLRRYLLEAEAAEAEEKASAQASSAPGKEAGNAAPVLPAQRKELAAQLTGTAKKKKK